MVDRAPGESALRAILSDRQVLATLLLALFVNLGTGMVLPILPLFARSLGAAYAEAGLLVGAYYLARLVFDLAAGAIVDRLGIAPAAAAGLGALALGALSTGLSRSFGAALVSWAVAGAGAAVVWAAMYNALIRSVPRARMARALGLFYGAFNSGLVAGGFLGGLVAARFGLPAPLLCLAAIAAGLAVLMSTALRTPPPAPNMAAPRPEGGTAEQSLEPGALLRIPGFPAAVMSLLANLWFFGAVFNTLVPLFARDVLHLSPAGIGVLYAAALAAEFVVYYPAGTWADTRGRRFVLMPAFACLGVVSLLVGFSGDTLIFALLLTVLGAASGFAGVPPAAMLADVLPEHRAARGVAIFRFGGDIGFALGPILCGLAAGHLGFRAAFAIAGIPSLVALLVVGLSRETLASRRVQTL
ncbi:MAG TPA: MFS transporter [Candidatus Limnocylindrales bacterium]|nr:MFS transporter [Candidatus Limnocylindrales bacterium]